MADPIRVLLVDDERDFTAMTAKYVSREHDDLEIETAASAAEGLDRLASEAFDCVVSDYEMPETDGLTFLERVRESHPEVPFIMFTGRGDERLASRAIAAGVTDYLPKGTGTGQYAGLVDRIRKAVTHRDTETALERSEKRYRRLVRDAPVPVAIYTREGLVFVNDPAVDFFGADRETLVERSPAAVVDADERLADSFRVVLDERTPVGPVEHRFRAADGRERVGRFSATPAMHGDEPAGQLVIDDVTEARRAADGLQRERQVADAVLSEAGTVAYATDADGRLQRWNDRLATVTGHADEEFSGTPVGELVRPADGDRAAVTERVREAGTATFDGHLLARDGDELAFEFREVRLTDGRGNFAGSVGVGWDAAEEDGRVRALKRQRDRLETIVENVPVALFAFDADGVLTLAEGRSLAAFGIDPGDPGRSVFDALGERDALLEACERALEGEAVETTVEFDDRAFDAWFEPVTDAGGDFQRVIGTAIDITERRERELDLERYRTVVEAAGDAMYAIDREGYMTMVNEAHAEFTGADREELLGSHVAEFMRPEDVRTGTEKIVELLKDDAKEAARFEIRDDDGDLYPGDEDTVYEDIIAVMTDEDGEYRGSVGVIRDITERKRRERQLRRQNERLDEFASVVAHDLRGPLTVAQGYVEMAAEEHDDENLREGMKSLRRMENLLEDLLALARQGDAVDETQPVLLAQVARDAWNSTDTPEATLELGDLGAVEADRSRLRQLFENLFRNAIEHAVEQSSTSPRPGAEDAGEDVTVRVGTLPERPGFYVADDGPGIPEDARETVFEHGYATSEEGTGFGLAIVRRIAGAHDWEVAATESESGGARFEITGAVVRDAGEGSAAGTESGAGD